MPSFLRSSSDRARSVSACPIAYCRIAFRIALCAFVLAASACDRPPPGPESDHPIEEPKAGFATSRACRSCHPAQYDTWYASYHRTMTQPANADTVLGDFDDVEVDWQNRHFRMFKRGDDFMVEIDDPIQFKRAEPDRIEVPIRLVTGRHHMQIYWYASGHTRAVGNLPLAYDTVQDRWFPMDSNFVTPPHDPDSVTRMVVGQWNHGCIQCHVVGGEPRWKHRDSSYTRVAEYGISCEACHGKAEAHVRANQDPRTRYEQHLGGAKSEDVVNPAKLSKQLGADVCGRCHSVWRFATNETYSGFMDRGVLFEPGDLLSESDLRVMTRYELDPNSFWPDHTVRAGGREYNGLIASPCFERGEMTCLSCHSLHPGEDDPRPLEEWADDQLKPGMRGNAACSGCHPTLAADLPAHTRHAADSPGSECQNCHMPHTVLGLRKAMRVHRIDSPSVESDLQAGRPNACNLCHLDRSLGWTAAALQRWYGQPVPAQMDDTARSAPAGLVLALQGDAGDRAIAAFAMGWAPAVEASGGERWMPLMLAELLDDPYDAVRYSAHRALRRLPGYENFEYDWVGTREHRQKRAVAAANRWASARVAEGESPDLGFMLERPEEGTSLLRQLRATRDNRPITINE